MCLIIGWFRASILLKIWILNDLRCFVAFWFCREIHGKKIWIRISQIQYGGGGGAILWKFFVKFRFFFKDGFPKSEYFFLLPSLIKNIDIEIDIDKEVLENIDIDIDIDKEVLENIDINIHKEILENIGEERNKFNSGIL